jgi:hypothetical protein
MRQSWAIVTAPATAVKAVLIIRGYNTGLNDPYVFFSRVYFGEAGAGQTEPSLWTPGRGIAHITSSNVTTYIANAAIGNAQIGGDIWSSNFVADSAGWRIYRNGNAEFRNITARGDIEASSLKANTLMVNRANIVNAAVGTLQIAGNAVTIPVHAYTSASLTLNSIDVYVDIQSAYVDPEGGSVSVVATFQTTQGETHARVLDPSGSVLCSVNNTGGCISLSAKSNLAGTYKLQAARSTEVNEATAIVAQRSLLLIGSKR